MITDGTIVDADGCLLAGARLPPDRSTVGRNQPFRETRDARPRCVPGLHRGQAVAGARAPRGLVARDALAVCGAEPGQPVGHYFLLPDPRGRSRPHLGRPDRKHPDVCIHLPRGLPAGRGRRGPADLGRLRARARRGRTLRDGKGVT